MEFLVLGYDGTDEKAFERRLAAREAHLAQARRWYEAGHWLWAAAILDDAGRPVGSMIVADFPSREALDEEWLRTEPYVVGGAWKRVEVHHAQSASFIERAGRRSLPRGVDR